MSHTCFMPHSRDRTSFSFLLSCAIPTARQLVPSSRLRAIPVQMRAARSMRSKATASRRACPAQSRHDATYTRRDDHATRAHLRQHTVKRRRRSMYEASGFFAVTSASSAFSAALPVAAICASCKPATLCSHGRGAAAAHGMDGSCHQWSVSARATEALRPTASWAMAIPTKHRPDKS